MNHAAVVASRGDPANALSLPCLGVLGLTDKGAPACPPS
jgi:hypothetical protein